MKTIIYLILLFPLTLLATFSGKVIDKSTQNPIINASISDTLKSVNSDNDGNFRIISDESILHVKACGYKPYKITAENNSTIVALKPFLVKAVYLSFWHASNNSNRMKKVVELIDNTDINTVVIDVKNEYGSLVYKTSLDVANINGAHKARTNRDIHKLMNLLKSKNIYTVARIVTFKDEIQASSNPEYAIKKSDGSIWRNHDNMAWVDPYDKRSHDYTLSIAEEAAKVGFDEINFDYIRFPAKDGLLFSKENTQENRLKAIEDFLYSAKRRLRKYGVFISVDTYGNICWSKDDNNIGQTVESLAKHTDYLSPMLYPSGFSSGSFYFKHPSEHPYEVIYRSIKNIKERVDLLRIRPWLQYFQDYTYPKKKYEKHEINEQIRAAEDVNASGWMMWSPSSKYHESYFSKEDE